MPRNKELFKKRNEAIYTKYKQLYQVHFLRHSKILEQLSQEFFLEEITIERIVLGAKKNAVNRKTS